MDDVCGGTEKATVKRPLLYYITDRNQFPGNEDQRRRKLLEKISEAASCGVDYVQLREKDLCSRELESLAKAVVEAIRNSAVRELATRLLINSRTDVALAGQADGVHLRSNDISVRDARFAAKFAQNRKHMPQGEAWIIAVSCHSEEEVRIAANDGANFVVFAPVFEKKGSTPAGLEALRRSCQYEVPVIALGGVTTENAQSCLQVGAAGIAGIRLFQENDISQVVHRLRRASIRQS